MDYVLADNDSHKPINLTTRLEFPTMMEFRVVLSHDKEP